MTNYSLRFHTDSLKEWNKLDADTRQHLARILARRLQNPRIESAALHGMPNCYKIKLRARGYRLVYQVLDDTLCVVVIAIGRRDKNAVYEQASKRHTETDTQT